MGYFRLAAPQRGRRLGNGHREKIDLLLLLSQYLPMKIDRLDHLVLTVRDVEATCRFYSTVLGMEVVSFGSGHRALAFGHQKINLHQAGHEYLPHAANPLPGSADLCFISAIPLSSVLDHLRACDVPVLEGPVERTGATGRIRSVYFRDPDQNLIEISEYL